MEDNRDNSLEHIRENIQERLRDLAPGRHADQGFDHGAEQNPDPDPESGTEREASRGLSDSTGKDPAEKGKGGFLSAVRRMLSLPDVPDDEPDEEDPEELLIQEVLAREEAHTAASAEKKASRKKAEARKAAQAAAQKTVKKLDNQSEPEKDPLRLRLYWLLQDTKEWVSDHLRAVLIVMGMVAAVLFFYLYNRNVTFNGYRVAASYENLATVGTDFENAGKYIFRYNGDGISCVNRSNDIKWSTTYSIQAPVADICGTTMAVAEQQGVHVYVVNTDGELGSFETTMPILKVRVSRQGLVALVLQEDDVTWVNLYQADGTLIASDKTSIMESGYPLDIALSPDGQRIAVSYVKIEGGVLSDEVVFYHFGQAGRNKDNHITASFEYEETLVSELYFVDNSEVVAIADDGYIVYSGKDNPKVSHRETFDRDIISAFHEKKSIGFVFANTDGEDAKPYRIELYDLRGRKTAETTVDCSYSDIRMQNGQVILFNDHSITVVTAAGHERFHTEYNKTVIDVFYFKEYRKYLVITSDSFDRIRIGAEES